MRPSRAAIVVLLLLACGTHGAPPPPPEPVSAPPSAVPTPPTAPPIAEPEPTPPVPTQPTPPAGASFDEAAVARAIRTGSGDVRRCYESRLRTSPTLHGRVEVAFTVLPTGGVDGVHAASNDTGDAQLAECIVVRVATLHFDPAPLEPVQFSFPFVFAPAS